MRLHNTRRGYTLFELIVVLAILVLLAAIIVPSVAAFRGSTRPRAAADAIRGELAIARARAKDEGRPYRVAVSEDGTHIRRAPDVLEFAEMTATDRADGSAMVVDYRFDQTTVSVVTEQDMQPPTSSNGWVTLATMMPDGTCRETSVLVAIRDGESSIIYLRIRGLTGSSRVVPNPTNPTGGTR